MARSVSFKMTGSTKRTQNFLRRVQSQDFYSSLESLAQRGVTALAAATPKDSGLTAASWGYEIETSGDKTKITWVNSHNEGGVNIAIILQYGHGTGTGGYVAGRDYINPAIKPVFDEIANDVWKKVQSL